MTDKRTASFGPYTLDLRSGEMRKFGVRMKIGEKPFQVLVALLERPGEMVSREELRAKLWENDTFVDFDHGLNSVVQRLRDCLSDTADNPKWVETVPRRGYRFVGEVEWGSGIGGGAVVGATVSAAPSASAVQGHERAAAVGPPGRKVTWIAGVATVGMLVMLWYGMGSRLRAKPAEPFQSFTTAQVTNNGKSIAAAISPDGKYLVYVVDDAGEQSVWLHHVPTNSDAQVIAPSKAFYQNLLFSPDGNFFYFRKANDEQHSSYDLLRAPVLGGAPQRIVGNLDTGISLSPDGSRMVYARTNSPPAGVSLVLTANADGTDEKVLSSGHSDELPEFMSWSADGKQLVTLHWGGGPNGVLGPIQVQNAQTGKMEAQVASNRMFWYDLERLPEGRGLLLAYQKIPNIFLGTQIGFLSSLGSQVRAITNDTNNYQTMTVSADGKSIGAVQQKTRAILYLLPRAGFAGVTPSPAAAQRSDAQFFGWAANGDIYFAVNSGDLLQMSADGRNRTTVLHDSNGVVMQMSGCPNGKYVLVLWPGHGDETKVGIWRVNIDGSNQKRLTEATHVRVPACDPKGKFAYYDDLIAGRIMRVPLEGGSTELEPEPVPGTQIPKEFFAQWEMSISPDGKRLAILVRGAKDPEGSIAMVPMGSGPNAVAKLIRPDPRVSGVAHFTPDGKAVVYPVREKGVENLWLQPNGGGRGRQITNFQEGEIGNFSFSMDGKTLGVLQKRTESEVVLLHDTAGR